MAVFPLEDTVTAVVAMMYFTPVERRSTSGSADQTQKCRELKRQTFVVDGVVVEASRSVFHSQAVPQREVINGVQVVFISWSQKFSVEGKVNFRHFTLKPEPARFVLISSECELD